MADHGSTATEVTKPTAKRSLFSKPTWAQSQASSTAATDTGDFFSRSSHSYEAILAEQERKRRLKLARKQKEAARRTSSDGREGKRRRISREEEDQSDDEDLVVRARHGNQSPDAEPGPVKSPIPHPPQASPSSLARRYEEVIVASKPAKEPVVIDLGDSDTEVEHPAHGDSTDVEVVGTTTRTKVHTEDEESDEEMRALAAKAREQRRLRELGAKDTPPAELSRSTSRPRGVSSHPASPTTQPDPVIYILITSQIPNTKPLVVYRKLSQRLQEIRTAWCDRQGFTPDFTDSVFLTWRNRRLFDVTTCKSLGISVDFEGKPVMSGPKGGMSEDGSRIQIEAVTQEIFEENKNRAERALRGEEAEEQQPEQEPVPEERPKADDCNIRIVLRAKGYEDHKLKVRPTTQFSKIMSAFRKTRAVPQDARVFLVFDGDRLNPDDTVQDADIEDMTSIEVHVKSMNAQ